jgi:hypothetical protein
MTQILAVVLNRFRAFIATWFNPPPALHVPLPEAPPPVSRTDEEDMWHAYEATLSGSEAPHETPRAPPPHARMSDEVRALERRRRKHDKFVTPQGPPVPHHPRPKTQEIEPKLPPKPPAEEIETDTSPYIADRHHEDSEKVLYTMREYAGEFTFRDTVLQQLDRYFYYLGQMKKSDPDAYALYRQVGAQIIPYIANGSFHRGQPDPAPVKQLPPLAEWFNKERPTFGCFAYGADPETEKYETNSYDEKTQKTMWVPKFLYYTKYSKAPPEVQMMKGGDIYVLTIWWHTPADPHNKQKYGTRQDIAFFVSKDGSQVVALRTIDTKWVPVRGKHETFHVPQREWRLAGEYKRWAKEHGQDPQHFLAEIFLMAIKRQEMAQYSMVKVNVRKGKMTAVFGVNHERMSYFFQDRDIHLTEGGRRKPIFHAVRAHTRSDGTVVPLQFRGERSFTWAGYDVLITVPGKHHADINFFDVGSVDEYWVDKSEKLISPGDIGKLYAEGVQHGKGAFSAALDRMMTGKRRRMRS